MAILGSKSNFWGFQKIIDISDQDFLKKIFRDSLRAYRANFFFIRTTKNTGRLIQWPIFDFRLFARFLNFWMKKRAFFHSKNVQNGENQKSASVLVCPCFCGSDEKKLALYAKTTRSLSESRKIFFKKSWSEISIIFWNPQKLLFEPKMAIFGPKYLKFDM